MLFRDSLIDAERAPKRPLFAWMEDLERRCGADPGSADANDVLAGVQNNHALITLHVLGPEAALHLCTRQIGWSFAIGEPERSLQPYVNRLRVQRILEDGATRRQALACLRRMATTGVGETSARADFALDDAGVALCAVNYVREAFLAFASPADALTCASLKDVAPVVEASPAAAVVHCEQLAASACSQGESRWLQMAIEGRTPGAGNYAKAVEAFYAAAFTAEWRDGKAQSEPVLLRLADLIGRSATTDDVDHRLLRFAAAISRVGRSMLMPRVVEAADALVESLARRLDDAVVLHRHLCDRGDARGAERLAEISGYGTSASVGPHAREPSRHQLAERLRSLDAAVSRRLERDGCA